MLYLFIVMDIHQRIAREHKGSIDKLIDLSSHQLIVFLTSNKFSQWISARVCKSRDSCLTSWHKITTISSIKTKMFSYHNKSIPNSSLKMEYFPILKRIQWWCLNQLTFLLQLNINQRNTFLCKGLIFFLTHSTISKTECPHTSIKVKISSTKSLTQLNLIIQWVLSHRWCPLHQSLTTRCLKFLI